MVVHSSTMMDLGRPLCHVCAYDTHNQSFPNASCDVRGLVDRFVARQATCNGSQLGPENGS